MTTCGPLHARMSRLLIPIALVALLAINLLPSIDHSAQPVRSISAYGSAPVPRSGPVAAIEGWVVDKATGSPLPGSTVILNDRIRTAADSTGYFSFGPADVRQAVTAVQTSVLVDVAVKAAGYPDWSLSGATYYQGDTLRVYPRLDASARAAVKVVAASRESGDITRVTSSGRAGVLGNPLSSSSYVVARAAAGITPPATIRVYRTGTSQVEVVPFRDYVKHTLPNEWIPTWGQEALRAGAMAVKTYAWYWISVGGKQQDLGADVKDNVDDQVYDPNVSYASTDAAVDATFNYVVTRSSHLFQAQYCAGTYSGEQTGACPWDGSYMTQWGSAYFADHGKPWGWILEFYYAGSTVSPEPPGGGYNGEPIPTDVARATAVPTSPPNNYTVGQGSARPDLFQAAYIRNGGAQALGRPTGPARWWLPYVSENNISAQPLSGADGRGNVWLVYDVLKSTSLGVERAYVLSGGIAAAYANHTPVGPEWVGAATSDPFILNGQTAQAFTKGLLTASGGGVTFTPWPSQFGAWKSEYFAGAQQSDPQSAPLLNMPGEPAMIRDQAAPDLAFAGAQDSAALGVGTGDWAAQFTRSVNLAPGTYDFTLSANSGARLWIDSLLAVNGWSWTTLQSTSYSADLDGSPHTIRIQYSSGGGAAQLSFTMAAHVAAVATPTTAPNPGQAQLAIPFGKASARISVVWLGRQAAPSQGWVQPLTLYLSAPGNPAILGTYHATTDQNGVAFYDGLPSGNFDVHVKGPHSLQTARANIKLTMNSTTSIDMKSQIEGDVDGDNCVTVNDFSVVQGMLGTNRSTPGFNPAADLNGDGEVTMADVSLLRSGFDQCGDISADTGFSIMSSGGVPSLSQLLAPWSDPAALDHDLGYMLVPGSRSAHVGQMVDVQVVADVRNQGVDGASFLVKFDPRKLTLVDSSGAPGHGAEPGLALPAVMGNWVDTTGGVVGYSAGILQGDPPTGAIVVATLHFRVVAPGAADLAFGPLPSGLMALTNGGTNLLATAAGVSLQLQP